MHSTDLWQRVRDRIDVWQIAVERVVESETSVLAFGWRGRQPIVLKVIRNSGDEWRSGAVLAAFSGQGTVRVYDYVDGAILMERARPGQSLVRMTLGGADDDASGALVETIRAIGRRAPAGTVPTVKDWGMSFERYAANGDAQVPPSLLAAAHHTYAELCESQRDVRLLHGDLHHGNVLFDADRGWLAVDPKGVAGELEYEVGAALRNPYERPELFADPAIAGRRIERFARELRLEARRVLAWGFSQAVLAAIWAVEDGERLGTANGHIALARALQPMLKMRGVTEGPVDGN